MASNDKNNNGIPDEAEKDVNTVTNIAKAKTWGQALAAMGCCCCSKSYTMLYIIFCIVILNFSFFIFLDFKLNI